MSRLSEFFDKKKSLPIGFRRFVAREFLRAPCIGWKTIETQCEPQFCTRYLISPQRLVGGGMPHTEDQRDSHRVRVQSPDELRRADGCARRQAGHRSSGRAADHHVYRLHHIRRLPGLGHSHVSIISWAEGNVQARACATGRSVDRSIGGRESRR